MDGPHTFRDMAKMSLGHEEMVKLILEQAKSNILRKYARENGSEALIKILQGFSKLDFGNRDSLLYCQGVFKACLILDHCNICLY